MGFCLCVFVVGVVEGSVACVLICFRGLCFNRQYMNGKGERTLRAYSRPVNLRVVYGGFAVGVGINLFLGPFL